MTILWFDSETYSECDLLKHGTARYAEHPSTEITVAQWALDDGEPQVLDLAWSHLSNHHVFLLRMLEDPDVIVAAHNSFFDRTLLRHCWGIDVPVERWYDVMVQALTHGLPGALGKIGPVMGLPDDQQKDKRGRELIQLFCKPRPKGHKLRRATRETHPVEWAEFLEYSRQDITSMRAVSKAMPNWNYNRETPNGRRNTRIWQIDQRINDRGILIDLDLAHAAIKATDQEKGRLKQEMVEATDGRVTNASRRDQLLGYILAEHGVLLPDMRADTLRRRMEDPELPEAVKLLLSIRLEATKTSTAKFKAMVDTACADNRIRGTMQFAGAQRTGRFAHRMVQPGNMKRPDMPGWEIELGIEALKHGTQRFLVDDVMNLCSNAVRGAIVAPPGKKLDVADLSNIEGRFLAFLAGEEWKLQAFRDYDAGRGPDLYVAAYARSFNVEHKTVDKTQRQIGKVQELGLGYQGGVAAFLTFAAVYNMDLQDLADAVWATASAEALTDAQGWWRWAEKKGRTFGLSMEVYVACQVLVTAWREAHPKTVKLWGDADEQVRLAIENPGVTFHVGEHVKVQRDGAWLRCRLPSGRYLCYLQPKVDSGGISYMGVDQYTRQWKRIRTYGGKLCIAEGELVLTRLRDWVPIEQITSVDEVWDGVEWVATGGAVWNGTRRVVRAYGALMTHDHRVLSAGGWIDASQSERHNRAACRLPDGVEVPRQRRYEVAVESDVCLPQDDSSSSNRTGEDAEARDHGVVRVHAAKNDRSPAYQPRDEQASRLRSMAQHARALLAAVTSGLGELRRAGHHGLRPVVDFVRELLVGHGGNVFARADVGTKEQRARLLEGQLRMGGLGSAGEQPPRDSDGGDPRRPHPRRYFEQADRRELDHDLLPAGAGGEVARDRLAPGPVKKVYDLVNCGPRHRFVIAAGGAPLIVHNCENWTQGGALDVLTENMEPAENEGYKIVLDVHDELVTETPDTPNFTSDRLAAIMATVPRWAPGLPLAAAGFETDRYKKE